MDMRGRGMGRVRASPPCKATAPGKEHVRWCGDTGTSNTRHQCPQRPCRRLGAARCCRQWGARPASVGRPTQMAAVPSTRPGLPPSPDLRLSHGVSLVTLKQTTPRPRGTPQPPGKELQGGGRLCPSSCAFLTSPGSARSAAHPPLQPTPLCSPPPGGWCSFGASAAPAGVSPSVCGCGRDTGALTQSHVPSPEAWPPPFSALDTQNNKAAKGFGLVAPPSSPCSGPVAGTGGRPWAAAWASAPRDWRGPSPEPGCQTRSAPPLSRCCSPAKRGFKAARARQG